MRPSLCSLAFLSYRLSNVSFCGLLLHAIFQVNIRGGLQILLLLFAPLLESCEFFVIGWVGVCGTTGNGGDWITALALVRLNSLLLGSLGDGILGLVVCGLLGGCAGCSG
ncbi:uncharacterized protein P174DRAFT_437750, partial [Aspergillus novofumigatus IBT 16806]